jgi:hypothetical protein
MCKMKVEFDLFFIYLQLWIIPSMFGTWWMLYLAKTKLQTYIAWTYGFALISLFSTSSLFHIFAFLEMFK